MLTFTLLDVKKPALHAHAGAPAAFTGQGTSTQTPLKNVGDALVADIKPVKPSLHVQPPGIPPTPLLLAGH